jgi:hypothetical protein
MSSEKNISLLAIGLLSFLVAACSAVAQYPPEPEVVPNPTPQRLEQIARRKALMARTTLMKRSLSVDRDTYLLGELIRMKISIENPTPQTLEIADPFSCQAGGINIFRKQGKEWVGLQPEPNEFRLSLENPATASIGGWQTMERTVEASDHFNCSYVAISEPYIPGFYRLIYTYGAMSQEFRIVMARLEGRFHVPLEKPQELVDWRTGAPVLDPQTGKQVKHPRELRLALLFAEEQYYLVVTRFGRTLDGSIRNQKGAVLDYSTGKFLYPFVRVAESAQPIVLISAQADADENLTVRWETSDGELHTTLLDANRQIIK